jgi:CheY-like chemotaxis protein
MLTARDAAADRVKGLDTGADDYLVKPFDRASLGRRRCLPEVLPGRFDVPRNLAGERIQGRKLHFIPQAGGKSHFEFLPVKVSFEVEQVGFEMHRCHRRAQRGTHSDVHCRTEGSFSGDSSVGCINSIRWKDSRCNIQVRRGETELSSKLSAAHDAARNGIAAAKHLTGGIQLPFTNGFANSRAADHLAIQRKRGEAMDLEIQLSPESA